MAWESLQRSSAGEKKKDVTCSDVTTGAWTGSLRHTFHPAAGDAGCCLARRRCKLGARTPVSRDRTSHYHQSSDKNASTEQNNGNFGPCLTSRSAWNIREFFYLLLLSNLLLVCHKKLKQTGVFTKQKPTKSCIVCLYCESTEHTSKAAMQTTWLEW